MTVRRRGFRGSRHIPPKGAAREGSDLAGGILMKLPKHRQFTRKRLRALVKRLLAGVSALTAVFTLVKLLVEIIQMLH